MSNMYDGYDRYGRYEEEFIYYRKRYEEEKDSMLRHISYLEERCRRLEEYAHRSNEDILHNMNINVIEKFLRKKKLENLDNK